MAAGDLTADTDRSGRDTELPVDFRALVEPELRWGDMDAFGHVNNTVFYRYFEIARIRYFELTGMLSHMDRMGVGPIVAEMSCRFIQPLEWPDRLQAGSRITRVGRSSFDMRYGLWSESKGLAATGSSVMVMVDYPRGGTVPMPDPLREAIGQLENRKVEGL